VDAVVAAEELTDLLHASGTPGEPEDGRGDLDLRPGFSVHGLHAVVRMKGIVGVDVPLGGENLSVVDLRGRMASVLDGGLDTVADGIVRRVGDVEFVADIDGGEINDVDGRFLRRRVRRTLDEVGDEEFEFYAECERGGHLGGKIYLRLLAVLC